MTDFNIQSELDSVYSQANDLSKGYFNETAVIFFYDFCLDYDLDFDDVVLPYLLKKVTPNERKFVEYLLEGYGYELKKHVIQIYHPISFNSTNYFHVAALEVDVIEPYLIHYLNNDDTFYSKYNIRDTRNGDILSLNGKYYIIKSTMETKEVELNKDFQLLEIKKSRV
jgi:hypothetical protein